jgi:hypothetical protein
MKLRLGLDNVGGIAGPSNQPRMFDQADPSRVMSVPTRGPAGARAGASGAVPYRLQPSHGLGCSYFRLGKL